MKKKAMKKKTSSLWAEFKKFISRGNVVDMAVGVAVASAFTAIVTAFTKGFVSPVISLLSSDADLDSMKWVIRQEVLDAEGNVTQSEIALLWGSFLQAIINFLIIALVMFLFLKIFATITKKANEIRNEMTDKLTGADKERQKAEEEAKAKEEAEKKAAEEAKAKEEAELAAEKARNEKLVALLDSINKNLSEMNKKSK